jgi:hypothetical protein
VSNTETAPLKRKGSTSAIALGLVFVLLATGLVVGGNFLYRAIYSPSAFVTGYLDLLSQKRAADALLVPGVSLERDALEDVGVTATISDALLRKAALAELTDIEILSETESDGIWTVAVSYRAGGVAGQSSFAVEQAGWYGFLPHWQFARSPIAAMELVVHGSDSFIVNGFTMDRRQFAGVESDPTEPVALLVLTPGLYTVTVDTLLSTAEGVSSLMDKSLALKPVTVQTSPTPEFRTVVQQKVEEFLEGCATQQVLQPTGCPFGYEISDRLASLPEWSITQHPEIVLEPDGANWMIAETGAEARLSVDVQSIYDGSVWRLNDNVYFQIIGTATVRGDGSVSIAVGSAYSW